MKEYLVLVISGVIFSIVAIMHFLRLIFRVNVIIGGKVIPLWVSVIGVIIPLFMVIWIFNIL